jgi:hypothetical protein
MMKEALRRLHCFCPKSLMQEGFASEIAERQLLDTSGLLGPIPAFACK